VNDALACFSGVAPRPTLLIDAPPGREPERRYILDVVLCDWLGLDWQLRVEGRPDVRIRLEGDASGRCVLLPDVLFGTPAHEWLTAASLPRPALSTVTVGPAGAGPLTAGERLAALYRSSSPPAAPVVDPEAQRLELDVFGSAFFMLTRYEEIVVSDRDRYGRFPASASVAGRSGLLRSPIVDSYVELLWSALERAWPGLPRKARRFGVLITHDVDDPLATLGRSPPRVVRQLAADFLLRRDPRLAGRRVRAAAAARHGDHRLDPYNTFDFLMDVSERNDNRSAFYFLANRSPDPLDGTYLLEHPWVQSLIGHIHRRGHEVGLHASFHSYRDPARTRDEFDRLRAVAEAQGVRQEQWGGRQHYLRWANPVTWSNWSEAGLAYDITLAYHDAVGFRTGTCHPYRVFDLLERHPLELEERPFQVMDGTLFSYMSLAPDAAYATVLQLASECRRFGGALGLLWHNSELATDRQKRWYESLVAAVSNP
jgi:Family of unknown function (DUF7033)